jgi:hypothetical protein
MTELTVMTLGVALVGDGQPKKVRKYSIWVWSRKAMIL